MEKKSMIATSTLGALSFAIASLAICSFYSNIGELTCLHLIW
jgi:hypothetical protein